MRIFLLLPWWVVGCGLPKADPCEDPALWYAPDGSGDVYWGCVPPQGWVETPPPETDTDTDTDTDSDTDTDTDSDSDADTDTGPPGGTGDTSGLPPDTASTGDTGVLDTADTGLFDTADTASTGHTGLPDTGDTAAPPLDTAPAGTGHTGAP